MAKVTIFDGGHSVEVIYLEPPKPGSPTDPTPPTPIPTPVESTLWDGKSGVTNNYFNIGALLPWEVVGGDWNDGSSTNADHGATPFAGTMLTRANAVGAFTIPVTPLAQYMKANGRRGVWLKTSGGYNAKIGSRTNANVGFRPFLTVDGARFDCLISAVLNPSSSYPQSGEELTISSALILEFDVDSMPAVFNSAVLTLYMTSVPSGGSTSYNGFAARYPKIFAGGTPTQGLAAGYAKDAGIAAHPDVYFASEDLNTTDIANYFKGGKYFADATWQQDADLGRSSVDIKYQKNGDGTDGTHANLSAFIASPIHRWSRQGGEIATNPSNGLALLDPGTTDDANETHALTPTELYFRYYIRFAVNYQCSEDGKKLPGLTGRLGWWKPTMGGGPDYDNTNTGGNGGTGTSGKYMTNVQATGHPGFSGWSMRFHAVPRNYATGGTVPGGSDGDLGNPYSDRIVANQYCYWVGVVDNDPKTSQKLSRWGNSKIQHDTATYNPCGVAPNGFVLFEAARWYCIEQYVKVNTLQDDPDALGNCTPNADGVTRGWVDGVLVHERMDWVLRRHPAIKINEVWIDHYHGGNKVPETDHTVRMSGIVVARSYIGPSA